jgi:dTDP-4-dehydrorhamnose 3,5-epimerase
MKIINKILNDVLIIKFDKIVIDSIETISISDTDLKELGINEKFIQDNFIKSYMGTLRGLHYQIEYPQAKLIQVLSGSILDFVVDLRNGSKTFKKSASFHINSEDSTLIYIPIGFAHGFYVTSETADILYKVDKYRSPKHERTLIWSDPLLEIVLPDNQNNPILSDKDSIGKYLNEIETF